jgi:transcription antitermination factor NusG
MTPHLFPDTITHWAALRTAANWEKKLAAQLADAGVPVFLPLMTRITEYTGKRRKVEVPVFGGYVFCAESDFLSSRRLTPGTRAKVAQVLRPPDPEQLRLELATLAGVLRDRVLVQERLIGSVGDVVRITGGPLTGFEGKIVRTKPNQWQLVLEVSFLGARLDVEVDERMVERAVASSAERGAPSSAERGVRNAE